MVQREFTYIWPLLHDSFHQFAASAYLPLLHSIGVAVRVYFGHASYIFFLRFRCQYHLRKAFLIEKQPFLQSFFSFILVALGGSFVAAVVTARPLPVLLNNSLLPIYTLGFLIVVYFPLTYTLLRSISFVWEPVFLVIDSVCRAWALSYGLDAFRNHGVYGQISRDAVVGQLIVGVLSVSAGGILYKWLLGINRFEWPGWDFSVIIMATTIYVSHSNGFFDAELHHLAAYGRALGLPNRLSGGDVRVLLALAIAVGFLVGSYLPGSLHSAPKVPPKPVVKTESQSAIKGATAKPTNRRLAN